MTGIDKRVAAAVWLKSIAPVPHEVALRHDSFVCFKIPMTEQVYYTGCTIVTTATAPSYTPGRFKVYDAALRIGYWLFDPEVSSTTRDCLNTKSHLFGLPTCPFRLWPGGQKPATEWSTHEP